MYLRSEVRSTAGLSVHGLGNSKPLFSVPQTSQMSTALSSPDEASKRSPQAVQKTRDPIADILAQSIVVEGSGLQLVKGWTIGRAANRVDRRVCKDYIARHRIAGVSKRAIAGLSLDRPLEYHLVSGEGRVLDVWVRRWKSE